jgi:hypothetical protein
MFQLRNAGSEWPLRKTSLPAFFGNLLTSRPSSGERLPIQLNALAQECLALAYQGLRTKDQSFNAELVSDLAPDLSKVEAVPVELGRVLLNLCHNAFYAVQQRQRTGETATCPPCAPGGWGNRCRTTAPA